MQQRGREVLLIWIPSHQGVYGNERADKAAKMLPSTEPTPPTKFTS